MAGDDAADLETTPAALLGDEPTDTTPPIPEFEAIRRNAAPSEADDPEDADRFDVPASEEEA